MLCSVARSGPQDYRLFLSFLSLRDTKDCGLNISSVANTFQPQTTSMTIPRSRAAQKDPEDPPNILQGPLKPADQDHTYKRGCVQNWYHSINTNARSNLDQSQVQHRSGSRRPIWFMMKHFNGITALNFRPVCIKLNWRPNFASFMTKYFLVFN